ncbi:MAG: hypothetical protein KDC14_01780 [Planctomycetes bacterium]|nr:hypothetical protein [Planctomycetota bacterium]
MDELPEAVRGLVSDGWQQRDAQFAAFDAARRARHRRCVLDGAVLFGATELLVSWVVPVPMLAGALLSAALVGALVGVLWIPLVGNRYLGLQLAAPLTAMPAYLALRFATGPGGSILDLRHLLGAFVLGLLAAWIGFCRDEELHGA